MILQVLQELNVVTMCPKWKLSRLLEHGNPTLVAQ